MSGNSYTPNLQLAQPPHLAENWDLSWNNNASIIDSALGALQAQFQGNWIINKSYFKGQTVNYGVLYYISLTDVNLANQPDVSPNSWTKVGGIVGPQGPVGPQGIQGIQGIQGPVGPPIAFIGNWNAATAYLVGQSVVYTTNSLMYVALANNTNVLPTVTATWAQLVAPGLSSTIPLIAGTGAAGVSPLVAHGDHVHPSELHTGAVVDLPNGATVEGGLTADTITIGKTLLTKVPTYGAYGTDPVIADVDSTGAISRYVDHAGMQHFPAGVVLPPTQNINPLSIGSTQLQSNT